jgi:hypothetical protein
MRLRQRVKGGVVWEVDEVDNSDVPWSFFELRLGADAEDGQAMSVNDGLALDTPHGVLFLEDDTLIASATGAHLPQGLDRDTRESLLRLACATWPAALSRALGGTPTSHRGGHDMHQAGPGGHRTLVLTLVSRDGARQTVPLRASPRTLLACATTPGRDLRVATDVPPARRRPLASLRWAGEKQPALRSLREATSAFRSGRPPHT